LDPFSPLSKPPHLCRGIEGLTHAMPLRVNPIDGAQGKLKEDRGGSRTAPATVLVAIKKIPDLAMMVPS
jgi:hypothetical protein